MAAESQAPTRRSSSRVPNKVATPSDAMSASSKRKTEERPASAKKAKPESISKSATPSDDKPKPTKSSSDLLEKGSSLPFVTLKDESGKDVVINELKKTVLFTYPKANTPGCTTQACLFRDEYAEFQKAGFQVFGLSADSEGSLKTWKEKKNFGYSLLSDPKRELIGALTGSKSSTIRSHFVIDADGKVALSAIKVKPVESSPAALKFAQSL